MSGPSSRQLKRQATLRRRGRAQRGAGLVAAVLTTLTVCLSLGPAASAQVTPAPPPTPAPSIPPDTTTSTTAVGATTTTTSSTTTTSTTTPSTTTTTTVPPPPAVPPPGAGVVPPPPPVPPLPALPDLAAKVAQATNLEQQIARQSTLLDHLSDSYQKAHQLALDVTLRLSQAHTQLTTAKADETDALAAIASAAQALRRTALDAYLDHKILSNFTTANVWSRAYQLGIAEVYSGSAIRTGVQRVEDLHSAERQLRDTQHQVEDAAKRAEADNTSATTADKNAQSAVQEAAVAQARLLSTISQIQGPLVTLVGIQKATISLAAYQQLSQAGTLLFAPPGTLGPQLPETTQAMNIAMAQLGKNYVWGGTGPDVFDCSGLMQWSWGKAGVAMPRVAADQQAWAVPVPISQVLPGDLVFFGNPAHHVGMYVGNGMMINAPHTGAVVEIASVWWTDLAGFGRVHR